MTSILYDNLADGGTVSVSSFIASTPPATLQNPHTTRRWQGRNGDTEFILLVFSASQSIDTVAFLKGAMLTPASVLVDMDASVSTRVRVSSVDTTGLAGDRFDSGVVLGRISYASLIQLLPTPVSAIAVRIDIITTGFTDIAVGRLVVGLRHPFGINYTYGWSFGFGDNSRLRKSAGGQTFVDIDDKYRVLAVSFNCITETERLGFVQDIDRLNGISKDVLFITNVSSSDLGRDSVWGLMQDMSPPTQPYFDHFNKSYTVQERL